ncbi:sialoadhesin isoform X2 [Alligator mississippiensis]|uniref:sialoadhesin isoform X2 n=1 Tax=Alligator mississippiensis TaxID=8496 RepID=UPI0028781026|nr:sialoadhesin isoform X2 [Alligator mississippiensis]
MSLPIHASPSWRQKSGGKSMWPVLFNLTVPTPSPGMTKLASTFLQGQTLDGAKKTRQPLSLSWMDHSMVLKCLVKGYRDECASDQTQPSRAELSVEISWLARRRLVQEGDSFTLRCQTVGQRPVLRYIWAHGNEWLQEAGQELHIPHAGVTDGGCFSCSVWVSGPNSGLLVSTRKSITVHYVPKGVHIMATLRTNVMEQETGALTCNYSSSVPSSVTYTWYKDHVVLNETRQKLELEDRGAEDAGEYWCEVKNEVGASQSSSFTIQAGCDRCYQLSPGLIAGVVGIDLLIIILFNVGAQCLLRRGQQQSQAAKGDMRSSHILEMESNYEASMGSARPWGLCSLLLYICGCSATLDTAGWTQHVLSMCPRPGSCK